MKIGIIGVGFVGNAINIFFKEKEEVLLYDKYKDGGIGKFEDILISDILYLCLPTLYSIEKKCYDTTALTETIEKLSNAKYNGIILIKSTVEPGFCKNINEKYNKLKIWHNPEFLTARTAIKDFANPTQIILGCVYERESYIAEKQILIDLHNKYFSKSLLKFSTSNESEIMKICINSFYAVKIQFFNEIFDLCKKMGTNYNTVKELMLNNCWINSQHTDVPGHDGKLSYGGACFPKDTNALLQFMKSNDILHNVLEATINERNKIRDKNIYLKDFKITKDEIIQPEKIKFLVESFNFKHYRWAPYICAPGNPNVLFNYKRIYFELGDFSFTKNIFNRVKNNDIIFATNNEYIENNKVYSLPIGVTSTSHCNIIGNIDVIVEQFKKNKQIKNLVYMNFNPSTYPIERNLVINKFKNKEWVTNGTFERSHNGHEKFIKEIYNHKFTLCPRGNGVDTHRLWMSLYLGTIPIVKFHKIMTPFKNLPILFINDWDEITPDFLKKNMKKYIVKNMILVC